MPEAHRIPLVLFAKTPVAGRVKIRLQPQCTPQQCADIARILIYESVQAVRAGWSGEVLLSVWPDPHHSFLRRLAADFDLRLHVQAEGDLGQKMHTALQQSGYPAAVMGCDVPNIPAVILQRAYQCLRDGQEIIGPSADGGYYMLGLNRPAPALFAGVDWGSDSVLAETSERANSSGRVLQLLPVLNDIDTWDDLIASPVPALQAYLKTIRQE